MNDLIILEVNGGILKRGCHLGNGSPGLNPGDAHIKVCIQYAEKLIVDRYGKDIDSCFNGPMLDFDFVFSETVARRLGESNEIKEYIKQGIFGIEQLKGNKDYFINEFGLPSKFLYGVRIYIISNKLVSLFSHNPSDACFLTRFNGSCILKDTPVIRFVNCFEQN